MVNLLIEELKFDQYNKQEIIKKLEEDFAYEKQDKADIIQSFQKEKSNHDSEVIP